MGPTSSFLRPEFEFACLEVMCRNANKLYYIERYTFSTKATLENHVLVILYQYEIFKIKDSILISISVDRKPSFKMTFDQ